MSETKRDNSIKKQNIPKTKPRFIVIREYGGKQSMRTAFEQMIEKQACDQLEQWLESLYSIDKWISDSFPT